MKAEIFFVASGHGGIDAGAVKGNRYEKNDNLSLAKTIKKVGEENGLAVFVDKVADKNIKPKDQAKMANKLDVDYLINVHRNAFNSKANGVEIWLHNSYYYKQNHPNVKACSRILGRLSKELGFTNRGVKFGYRTGLRYNFAINSYAKMPSGLFEIGFITNTKDNKIFDEKQEEIAQIILEELSGIEVKIKTYEKENPEEEKKGIKMPETLEIRKGLYSDPERAEKDLRKMNGLGIGGLDLVSTEDQPSPSNPEDGFVGTFRVKTPAGKGMVVRSRRDDKSDVIMTLQEDSTFDVAWVKGAWAKPKYFSGFVAKKFLEEV